MKKVFVILSFFSTIILITEVVWASTPIGYIDQGGKGRE